jgi:hypothetical protein
MKWICTSKKRTPVMTKMMRMRRMKTTRRLTIGRTPLKTKMKMTMMMKTMIPKSGIVAIWIMNLPWSRRKKRNVRLSETPWLTLPF